MVLRVLIFIIVGRRFIVGPEDLAITGFFEEGHGHLIQTCLMFTRFPVVKVDSGNTAGGLESPPEHPGIIIKSDTSEQLCIPIVKSATESCDLWNRSGRHVWGCCEHVC